MTGLDQDMMQKNLSCRNLKDAQKYGGFQFCLGICNSFIHAFRSLLYIYAQGQGIGIPPMDGAPKPICSFPKLL